MCRGVKFLRIVLRQAMVTDCCPRLYPIARHQNEIQIGAECLGGAGAALFIFFPLIYGGTALVWLLAAVFAWMLVLPRWTFTSILFCLVSCCFHAIVWYQVQTGTVPHEPSMFGGVVFACLLALTVLAFVSIPAALILEYRRFLLQSNGASIEISKS